MNILLLAFALPVAVVILSIGLQKILRSPILVSATFFRLVCNIISRLNMNRIINTNELVNTNTNNALNNGNCGRCNRRY